MWVERNILETHPIGRYVQELVHLEDCAYEVSATLEHHGVPSTRFPEVMDDSPFTESWPSSAHF